MNVTGNVLIIDGDQRSRQIMSALLTDELPDISVDKSGDPDDAVGLADNKEYDLFIIDTDLYNLSGVNLASVLSGMNGYKDTPIIFVSAVVEERDQIIDHFPDVDVFMKPLGEQSVDFTDQVHQLIILSGMLSNMKAVTNELADVKKLYSREDGSHVGRKIAS